MSKLVIVESPTKAKTIARFLGQDYVVESSYGHIRDLPKKDIGVDVDHDFKPTYEIPDNSKKQIAKLKKATAKADEVILASDEDREGEAIAWHLTKALKLDPKKTKRIVFHEITKKAIAEALENPRTLNQDLVDAQQARRVLDRLVGYKLSPLLWKKVRMGLSAGRVQSVTVRLIVEREREIEKFKPQEYWSIEALLSQKDKKEEFIAKLAKKDGKVVPKLGVKNKKEADQILADLKDAKYKIVDVRKKERKKSPAPPFITSTLQQEAARKLGFSAKQTMMFAQRLYEGITLNGESTGLISYMRTDSYNLSEDALKEAKDTIVKEYGAKYALDKPRYYKKKSKGAQEAHEAVRPTSPARTPESIKEHLEPREFKLYRLIWQRMIACQMTEAVMDSTAVDIEADKYLFRANGSVIKFDGFIKVYIEGRDDNKKPIQENLLPDLSVDEILRLIKLDPQKHSTEPPARYSDASLIKALEERGIGRPSTYAPTLSTVTTRGYVEKEEKRYHPKDIGVLVNDLLVEHFPNIVDFEFTAKMEEDLDDIAEKNKEWVPVIAKFYEPFAKNIKIKDKQLDKKEITEKKTDKKCPECKKPMVIKFGRFGQFYACSGYPDCKKTEPLEEEKKEMAKLEEESKEKCEKCGAKMLVKRGRFGPFLACSKYPDCKSTKAIMKPTGVKCPKCNKGDIVEKKSKKGRLFFACDQYPDCKNAMWTKPTGDKCKKCGNLMVFAAKGESKCGDKDCKG
ncbi:MAG: type I DNA topoisomerase [Parcubacteria group bacterium]|nr:type I DNA topoisomerase [Parcubacteria group bacterium]